MKALPALLVGAFSLHAAAVGAQTKEAAPRAVANGFVLQPRMETQPTLLGSTVGSPGFLLGVRAGDLTAGVGGTLTAIAVGDDATNTKVSASLFQIVPSVAYDVWQSNDGRARFSLLGAVGYGRAKVTITDEGEESSVTVQLVPLRAAAGGDYFLHPNFGLGGEAGFQSLLLASSKVSGQDDTKLSFASNSVYGALRLTFIVGQ